MLDSNDLSLALDLHRRSYQLLLWLTDVARDNRQLTRVAHESLTAADAAGEWLKRNYGSLPKSTRPESRHLDAYAQFFSTYLTTSFEYDSRGRAREVNPCGCWCRYCSFVVNARGLTAKRVGSRDKKRSIRLMEDRLIELAYEEGVARPGTELYAILDDRETRLAAAWSTYGQWLIRRCSGRTDGASVLALWRTISSSNSRVGGRRPELRLQEFVEAEEMLVLAIGEVSRRRTSSVRSDLG